MYIRTLFYYSVVAVSTHKLTSLENCLENFVRLSFYN